MQPKLLQNFLCIPRELFMFLVGLLRARELDQFYFLKLVLANDAAHVLAVRPSFATEARSVSRYANRQLRLIENLVAIQICDRNLRGRNQPQILVAVRHAK